MRTYWFALSLSNVSRRHGIRVASCISDLEPYKNPFGLGSDVVEAMFVGKLEANDM
jgi:hypothetical protein